MRNTAIVVMAGVVLISGCSSTDPYEATPTTRSGAAAVTTTTGAPSDPAAESAFAIPPALLARVEAAGLTTVDVDYPPQPEGVAWPTTEWVRSGLPSGVDAAAVDGIVERAFTGGSGDGDTVDAILVVHGGELVLERYNRWDPQARHNSWSMAKSITQSMVGILEHREKIDIFERATAEEWADPSDPRNAITLDMLLRMSSGLQWDESYTDPNGDVLTILGERGKADRAGYTAAKPLEADPDTMWEYSTGTSDIIGREVGSVVGFGPEYEAWIQAELFDPLGIIGADHQFDEKGVTNAGSWINLRTEDFARFGLLYLRGGEWDGRRLLDESWVDYSRLPTPTDPGRQYGAQWWLHDDPVFPEVFYASGFNGQSITVMPNHDTVIVVLSTTGTDRDLEARDALMREFAALR